MNYEDLIKQLIGLSFLNVFLNANLFHVKQTPKEAKESISPYLTKKELK